MGRSRPSAIWGGGYGSCHATRWNGLRLRALSTACATRGGRYCGVCPLYIARRAAKQSPWSVSRLFPCRLSPIFQPACRTLQTRSGSSGNGRRFSFHRKDIPCTFIGSGQRAWRAVLRRASGKQAGRNGANCRVVFAAHRPAYPIRASVCVFHARRRNGPGSGDGRAGCIRNPRSRFVPVMRTYGHGQVEARGVGKILRAAKRCFR